MEVNLLAAFPALIVLVFYGVGAAWYVKWLRRIDFMGFETDKRHGHFSLMSDSVMNCWSSPGQ
jgi:hypothetical protein